MNLELNNWLINAFNGEWLKVNDAKPNDATKRNIDALRRRAAVM
jgi:dipeptidyl aminopeptidase B